MNRRISDLLDTYSDPNIELGINTPLSSERIKALTMSKINKEPKQRKRIKELNSDVDGYYQMFSTDHFSELESPVDAYDLPEDSPLAPMGVQWKFDWLPDDDPTDNRIEVVVRLVKTNGIYAFNDGVEKWVTFHGLWIQSPYKEYTQILDGEFSFDVSMPEEVHTITVPCDNVSVYDSFMDCTVTMDSIQISTLSMKIFSHYTETDSTKGSPGCDVQIFLKDGTELPLALGCSSDNPKTRKLEAQFIFDSPVVPAEIDYLLFDGEHKLDISE